MPCVDTEYCSQPSIKEIDGLDHQQRPIIERVNHKSNDLSLDPNTLVAKGKDLRLDARRLVQHC